MKNCIHRSCHELYPVGTWLNTYHTRSGSTFFMIGLFIWCGITWSTIRFVDAIIAMVYLFCLPYLSILALSELPTTICLYNLTISVKQTLLMRFLILNVASMPRWPQIPYQLECSAGSGTWTHESRKTSASTSMNSYWSRGWPLLGSTTYLAWVPRQGILQRCCNLMFFVSSI